MWDLRLVALALAFQLPTLPVSIPIVIVASFLIMMISQKKSSNGDVVIGIVATASLALGVVITAWSGGFNVDVSNYMFGSILAINRQDVILSMVLGIVVIALFVLFYNRLFLITYDRKLRQSHGCQCDLLSVPHIFSNRIDSGCRNEDDGNLIDIRPDYLPGRDCQEAC